MKTIYLDNNATTKPLPVVREAVIQMLDQYGNPSSPHGAGLAARKAVEEARSLVAQMIGAGQSEIVFTSGGTESIVTAFASALDFSRNDKRPILLSAVEHTAVLEIAEKYQKLAHPLFFIPVDRDGLLDTDFLKQLLSRNKNSFLSIMAANNETGVIFPVKEICGMAKKHGAIVHLDAVQAAGKLAFNVQDIGCDFLSLSAHKFHGLKGAGALYVRSGSPFSPLFRGHQEGKRRGGTENVPAIVGMGAAAAEVIGHLKTDIERMSTLRDLLESSLLKGIQGSVVNGDVNNRLCNTTNITFPEKDSAMLVEALSAEGVYVSSGAACTTGGSPSHVLKAMGRSDEQVNTALRLSVGKLTNKLEMNKAVDILIKIVKNSMTVYY